MMQQPPAVDLPAAWDRFLAGAETPGLPTPAREAWERCRDYGLDPRQLPQQSLDENVLRASQADSRQLLQAALPHLRLVDEVLHGRPHLLLLVESEGIVLRMLGDGASRREARAAGLSEGVSRHERLSGCNGAGTALATGRPVMLDGQCHFLTAFSARTSIGVPLRGPDGSLIGALDLLVPTEHLSQETWGWMLTLGQAIQAGLAQPMTNMREQGVATEMAEVENAFNAAQQVLDRLDDDVLTFRGDPASLSGARATIDRAESRLRQRVRELLSTRRRLEDSLHHLERQVLSAARERDEKMVVLQAIDSGIFQVDRQGRIIFVNRAAAELLGYAPDELIGQDAEETLRSQDGSSVLQKEKHPLAVCLRTGQPVHREHEVFRRRDGQPVTAECSCQPVIQGGEITGAVITFRDISERQGVVERLRFLVKVSRRLANSLDYETTLRQVASLALPHLADWCTVNLVEHDGQLRLVAAAHANPSKTKLLHELWQRYPPELQSDLGLPRVLRTGRPVLYRYVPEWLLTRYAPSPERRQLLREIGFASYICVPLEARGKTLGTISLVSGLSGHRYNAGDLALAEAVARRCALAIDNARLYQEVQQALKTREEFLASVAHDLRTPLTAIKGWAQFLQRQLPSAERATTRWLSDGLDRIDVTVTKMTRQVNELLDITRTDMGQPLPLDRQQVDLVALAGQVVAQFRLTHHQHDIRLEADAPSLVGWWDGARLERVLANLLSNAVTYSPGGTTVTLTLATDEPDWAVVRVTDQGIGIPSSDLPRVFERFYRASNAVGRVAGTGIGLVSVCRTVEQHGGSIRIESREGVGTTAIVRLPRSAAPEGP